MPTLSSFDYAIIRVVPRVEREEFVNVGAIVHCRERPFLGARVTVDRERLAALAPELDLAEIQAHLDAILLVCKGGPAAGPIGSLSRTERFHWLVAPRSTVIQTSPVHSGLSDDPAAALEHLMATMVRLSGAVESSGT